MKMTLVGLVATAFIAFLSIDVMAQFEQHSQHEDSQSTNPATDPATTTKGNDIGQDEKEVVKLNLDAARLAGEEIKRNPEKYVTEQQQNQLRADILGRLVFEHESRKAKGFDHEKVQALFDAECRKTPEKYNSEEKKKRLKSDLILKQLFEMHLKEHPGNFETDEDKDTSMAFFGMSLFTKYLRGDDLAQTMEASRQFADEIEEINKNLEKRLAELKKKREEELRQQEEELAKKKKELEEYNRKEKEKQKREAEKRRIEAEHEEKMAELDRKWDERLTQVYTKHFEKHEAMLTESLAKRIGMEIHRRGMGKINEFLVKKLAEKAFKLLKKLAMHAIKKGLSKKSIIEFVKANIKECLIPKGAEHLNSDKVRDAILQSVVDELDWNEMPGR